MSSVLEISKKLNKERDNKNYAQFADTIPQYERFACGALGIDYTLYGGLPLGRMCVFSGKQHSGKTTAAVTELAAYQRKYPDKVCVFVDVEHSLDKEFQCKMTGLDLTKLLYINPEGQSGEEILKDILMIQEEADDIGMIILDSIPALISGKELEDDLLKDSGKAGNMAKPLHKFCKRMIPLLSAKKNIFIFINQVREKGQTYTGAIIYGEPGGDAPKYYSSVSVRFGNRTFTKEDKVDCSDGEGADGFRLQFVVTKNKTASTQRGGGFITYRYNTGLDWMHDLLEIALEFDFIQRPNNQTYILVNLDSGEVYLDSETQEPLKFRGKQKLFEYLSEHVEFQTRYIEMIQRHILSNDGSDYGSLLDAREVAFIKEQEASIEYGQGVKVNEETPQ